MQRRISNRTRALALVAAVATGIALAAVAPAADPAAFDPLAQGRMLTRLFFASRLDSLQGVFNAQMTALMTPAQLAHFREQVGAQLGDIGAVAEETVEPRDSLQVYTRTGRFTKLPEQDILVVWAFDPRGKVAGFYVQPAPSAAPSRFLEYETKTPLRLPFGGEWYVFWGGRAVRDNQHAVAFDQRFALDLVIRKDGASHTGDGTANEHYYCWGAPLVAPGPGTVLAVTDGIADNRPGKMDEQRPLGNHVIIDHGNDEFSFLCHFQRGTIQVAPGQVVKAGDALGLCGNSGRSSEPHLHYHLQNKSEPFKGEGLPAQFLDYRADGAAVARGEPKRGQTVAHDGVAPKPATGKKKANSGKVRSGVGDGTRSGDTP